MTEREEICIKMTEEELEARLRKVFCTILDCSDQHDKCYPKCENQDKYLTCKGKILVHQLIRSFFRKYSKSQPPTIDEVVEHYLSGEKNTFQAIKLWYDGIAEVFINNELYCKVTTDELTKLVRQEND